MELSLAPAIRKWIKRRHREHPNADWTRFVNGWEELWLGMRRFAASLRLIDPGRRGYAHRVERNASGLVSRQIRGTDWPFGKKD